MMMKKSIHLFVIPFLTQFLFLFSFAAARETVATAKSNAKREAMRFSRQQGSADAAVTAAAGPPPPDLAAERALEVQEQVQFYFLAIV